MEIATSGVFRRPASRGAVAAVIALAIGVLSVLGYVAWRRWLYEPSPASVCERVERFGEPASFERSAFSTLDAGDTRPRGDGFHDRCLWFFESMQEVDGVFYGEVARCIDRADDQTSALRCTYSP